MNFLHIFLALSCSLFAGNVIVEGEQGEEFLFEIDFSSETFDSFGERVESLISSDEVVCRFILDQRTERNQGGALGYPRDYNLDVSSHERRDIQYIVRTLANKSVIAIAKERNNLQQAGDRIDHVHPLRFLMTLFTDEELKVGIRNIRGKGWVWSNFVGGIKDSLRTEAGIQNMKLSYLADFAEKVDVEIGIILPAAEKGNWDLFIDLLIKHVPRQQGNEDRYDC
ncbi:MAG: hypothetical protein ACKVOH_03295 [Chlamydiales bacterium]